MEQKGKRTHGHGQQCGYGREEGYIRGIMVIKVQQKINLKINKAMKKRVVRLWSRWIHR